MKTPENLSWMKMKEPMPIKSRKLFYQNKGVFCFAMKLRIY